MAGSYQYFSEGVSSMSLAAYRPRTASRPPTAAHRGAWLRADRPTEPGLLVALAPTRLDIVRLQRGGKKAHTAYQPPMRLRRQS